MESDTAKVATAGSQSLRLIMALQKPMGAATETTSTFDTVYDINTTFENLAT